MATQLRRGQIEARFLGVAPVARTINDRDMSKTIEAAERWIAKCILKDESIFLPTSTPLWTRALIGEVAEAFIDHPDTGPDSFMIKLRNQLAGASLHAKQLAAEMLWALLLFPSNMNAATKRRQIREIWELSGQALAEDHELLSDKVLFGIGSGGPGFNTYRPLELAFLISSCGNLKDLPVGERQKIVGEYERFMEWIDTIPQDGHRQYRHMLRYFCFPDFVERMSSNNDRHKILQAFEVASLREARSWSDKQLDKALHSLRVKLESTMQGGFSDYYQADVRAKWSKDRTIKTPTGEVTVSIPSAEDELEAGEDTAAVPEARQSIQIQAKLAEIGATMGFKVWIPRADRVRVKEQLRPAIHAALIDELPLSYDSTTLDTIQQIDVLWLRGRSIGRAFEVEHTTAVYSGLLRMADLLALVPNMDVRLHIVAPEERRDKVFREMKRPVFSLLERGPLSNKCTYISYESVEDISGIPHLAYTHERVIEEYEERADEILES